jgi:hypothetical protein
MFEKMSQNWFYCVCNKIIGSLYEQQKTTTKNTWLNFDLLFVSMFYVNFPFTSFFYPLHIHTSLLIVDYLQGKTSFGMPRLGMFELWILSILLFFN